MTSPIWILIFALIGLSQTPEEIASRTEAKFRSIQSIQSTFEQIYYSSSVSTPLREKGKFYFQTPDLMKWEYLDPEKKIFIYKDRILWSYIPEDEQIIKNYVSEEEENTEILFLLSGQIGIRDNYSLEFSPFPTENRNALQLKLTPKKEDIYSFILLEISGKSWLIQKAIFFDWAGNKTEFQFKQIKTNINLSQDLFELDAPPGVEIIENEIPQNLFLSFSYKR
ncbi:outer membrane lipoprotein carrier protein LolA [Acidobacteriota bacterium]